MSSERPSLQRDSDFGEVTLSYEQRPLVPWAVLAHLSVFVVMPLTMFLGMPFIGVPWFLFAVIFFMVGLSWKRRATFELGPTELRVDAWVGFLPRHTRLALPLDGLEVDFGSSAAVNKRTVYKLFLKPKDAERLRIPSLACTDDGLDELQRAVEEHAVHARLLMGEGEEEVPTDLRQLQREAEPLSQ